MIWAECLKANNLLYSCVLPDVQWLHSSELCQAALSVVKPNECNKTCFSQSIRRKWCFQWTYVIHLHLGFIIQEIFCMTCSFYVIEFFKSSYTD